jgi:hypothetical protein
VASFVLIAWAMTTNIFPLLALLLLAPVGCTPSKSPVAATDGGADVPAAAGATHRWNFDEMPAGTSPTGFINVLGNWQVQATNEGPGANARVLRQTGTYNNLDFPRIVVPSLSFGDVKLAVRCRAESGDVDRACGVMFRLEDSFNYYVVRANALEGNINFYRVVADDRQQIAGGAGDTGRAGWHDLEVTARGNHFIVLWDGKQVLDASDSTFLKSGKIGLWTKADSVTAFDDFTATAL